MGEIAKFLFDTSFAREADDERFAAGKTHDGVAGPLARARAEGAAEARRAIEKQLADALSAIGSELRRLRAQHGVEVEKIRSETARLAFAIARKLVPHLLKREPQAELEAMIKDCLAELRDEPRIVARAAPETVEALKPRIDRLANDAAFAGSVILLADTALGPDQCRLEWADGGAERDQTRVASLVEAAIDRYLQRRP
jgi:flagellar assembly protein FliH